MARFEEIFDRVKRLTDYETMARAGTAYVRTLDGVTRLSRLLDDPHRSFRSIHVVGTKGKGSTCEMIAAGLRAAGARVGLYTSPHVESITERIRVDGVPVREDRLADLFERSLEARGRVEPGATDVPTFFDLITVAAFVQFRDAGVDWAVVEAGLGGRLDSTNLIRPEAVVLTNVSLDHTSVLGPDLASIAREKAGAVKRGSVVAAGVPRDERAAREVRAACRDAGAPLLELHDHIRFEGDERRFSVEVEGERFEDLSLGVLGEHQVRNASLAVAVLCRLRRCGRLDFEDGALRRALARVRLPGRGELMSRRPVVLLDGAHNPASAEALRRMIGDRFGRPASFVAAVARDKDVTAFLRALLAPGDTVIATRARNPRGLPPVDLAARARALGATARSVEDPVEATLQARAAAGPGGLVCVTGSMYLVGEVRAARERWLGEHESRKAVERAGE